MLYNNSWEPPEQTKDFCYNCGVEIEGEEYKDFGCRNYCPNCFCVLCNDVESGCIDYTCQECLKLVNDINSRK